MKFHVALLVMVLSTGAIFGMGEEEPFLETGASTLGEKVSQATTALQKKIKEAKIKREQKIEAERVKEILALIKRGGELRPRDLR